MQFQLTVVITSSAGEQRGVATTTVQVVPLDLVAVIMGGMLLVIVVVVVEFMVNNAKGEGEGQRERKGVRIKYLNFLVGNREVPAVGSFSLNGSLSRDPDQLPGTVTATWFCCGVTSATSPGPILSSNCNSPCPSVLSSAVAAARTTVLTIASSVQAPFPTGTW